MHDQAEVAITIKLRIDPLWQDPEELAQDFTEGLSALTKYMNFQGGNPEYSYTIKEVS